MDLCGYNLLIGMSIYSGFATRFQQESYDHCIDSLLYVLQKRIIKFYQNERTDQQKFIGLVTKLHQQMRHMEKSKYLEPKSSHSILQLIKYIQQQPNILALSYTHTHQKEHPHQLPQIDPKPTPPQSNDKKKNTLWVQKLTPAEKDPLPQSVSNKTVTQQQVQTMGTINRPIQPKPLEQRPQFFRRTAYQHTSNLQGLKVKNSSKSNLSGEVGERSQEKQKRAMSNYLQQKPPIKSTVTYYNSQSQANHAQKRKHKSISRNNNDTDLLTNKNQVSDIIKDYIIKAKKNYLKNGRLSKDKKESLAKLQDF